MTRPFRKVVIWSIASCLALPPALAAGPAAAEFVGAPLILNSMPPSVSSAPPSVNSTPPSVNSTPPSVSSMPPSLNLGPPSLGGVQCRIFYRVNSRGRIVGAVRRCW
jgi:hypothetical protein